MKIFIIVTVACLTYSLSAQRLFRKYASQAMQEQINAEDIKHKKNLATMDLNTDEWKIRESRKQILLPIVFHVLSATGQFSPSDEDIHNQIQLLNLYFSSQGTVQNLKHPAFNKENFKDKLANTGISFCLASEKNKNLSSIIRKTISKPKWVVSDSMKYTISGGDDAWKNSDYLNIWIVYLPDTMAGYSQMPGGPDATDGVVINTKYFGYNSPINHKYYNEGKSLVHLIGNYLGLYDLWSDSQPCDDDHVDDTPIHNMPTYGSVDLYGQVSTCYDKPVAMSMNFMDNTDDRNLFMFTYGQMARMQALFGNNGLRKNLGKSNKSNCNGSKLIQPEPRSSISQNSLEVYPNPANHEINIKYINAEENKQLIIYNAIGQIIYYKSLPSNTDHDIIKIPANKWQAGIYFVLLTDGKQVFNKKVILSH